MAFCTNCGKKLADGEVCDCRNQVAPEVAENPYAQPAMEQPVYAQNPTPAPTPVAPAQTKTNSDATVFGAVLNLFKNTIKNPVTAAEDFFHTAPMVSGIIMIGGLAVVYWFSILITMLVALIKTAIKLPVTGGTLLDHISLFNIISTVFYPFLYIALMFGIVLGTAFLVNAVVLKGKVEIPKVITFCGAVVVPLIAESVIRLAYYFIPISGLALPFRIICHALGLLTFLQGLNILHNVIPERKKLVLSLMISTGTLALGSWLLEQFMHYCRFFVTLPF